MQLFRMRSSSNFNTGSILVMLEATKEVVNKERLECLRTINDTAPEKFKPLLKSFFPRQLERCFSPLQTQVVRRLNKEGSLEERNIPIKLEKCESITGFTIGEKWPLNDSRFLFMLVLNEAHAALRTVLDQDETILGPRIAAFEAKKARHAERRAEFSKMGNGELS
jgi:hypothetical protein